LGNEIFIWFPELERLTKEEYEILFADIKTAVQNRVKVFMRNKEKSQSEDLEE